MVNHKSYLEIPGATSVAELNWLYKQAKGKKFVYEIGSYLGRSTVALLESGAPIYAVDDFKGLREEKPLTEEQQDFIYKKFTENTKGYENLHVLICDHKYFFPSKKCDMAFIDGCHYYEDVTRDIMKFKDHKDILICGHDYLWWNSVREAVNTIFGKKIKLASPNLWYVTQ